MPTRLIREGIINSDRVNALDWPAECFYRRLLNRVDDHGLFDARPAVLRAALYPLKIDRVREADCSRWIAECEKAGLIVLYEAAGKPYLQVLDTRWKVRSEPRFPVPPKGQLQTTANKCLQLLPKSLSLSESLFVDGVVNPPTPQKRGAIEIPEDLQADAEAITAWLEYKREMGKAYKSRGLAALWGRLRAIPQPDRKKAIDHSMANGWAGIFEPKGGVNDGSKKSGYAAPVAGKYES